MDLNTINNSQVSKLSNLNDNSNVNNLKTNEIISNNFNKNTNSYSISDSIIEKRSNLYSNLNQFISNISSSQIELSNLNKQNDILNSIDKLTNKIKSSQNIQSSSIQEEKNINELVLKYNDIIPKLKLVSDLDDKTTNSHSYFDGAFGARPLDINDLSSNVLQKQEEVKQNIKLISSKIEKIQEKASNVIQEEVIKTKQSQPFKNIDFGKHTSDFSSANINNIIGSVALSQANAIPSNSPRLLA